MKYLLMVIVLMITPLSFASVEAQDVPVFDWANLIVTLFGEQGKTVVIWISFVLVIWSQLRQLVPAVWIAKLPIWLIDVLEFLAANKGKAGNEAWNDPKHLKRVKK